MLDSLIARSEMRRKAGEIYGVIVTRARCPEFYSEMGVLDTPSGRYEMVVLHLFLVLERLRTATDPSSPIPRLLVEAFVSDMDDSLRELGTGDLAVPKKVRRAADGLLARSMAYRAALETGNERDLAKALAAHVYDGAESAQARSLAQYMREALGSLAAMEAVQILDGSLGFPKVCDTAAEAP
ncbi:ubiquinol-cytochrome C chaperone family protein [Hyphomicrobium sp.]|uniref:ubiquinol-cytochrome C chaperone family protein n=1 Tax=Hyphomicrobium sp. TaxID=82 RepID=UPI00132AFB50|nr:ubiquinol-cytochrome C chaperone family protein [Hyphomicrobium sp.]KAB2943641.1 MAG: ubiquinol-cytochrome C chaperone [Hyphomicrobium sp.]